MLWHKDNYHLATTQGDCIRMWKAPSLRELKSAPGKDAWRDADPSPSHGIWEPAFHYISNRWYLSNPKTRVGHPNPVFERNDAADVSALVTTGFFKSPDNKEDWIVYRARTTSAHPYAGRMTRMQQFRRTAERLPDFGVPLPVSTEISEPSGTR